MQQKSSHVGPWTLVGKLGSGGNADVYEATRPGWDKPVALKVIQSTRIEREPYKRFVQEVRFLQSIEGEPGVLPLLDAHLPEKPSGRDKAWLAMPIATRIDEALEGKPLEVVVAAVAEIAGSLAREEVRHEGCTYRPGQRNGLRAVSVRLNTRLFSSS